MARLLGFCIAFLFASSVAASTIDVGPSDWRNYGPNGSHTGQGVKSTFGQSVRLPPTISGPTRVLPVSRNPVIPYGSVTNSLRAYTRINPASVAASAAITALFLGLDWVFDDELDRWMKQGHETVPALDSYWANNEHADLKFPTMDAACSYYHSTYTVHPSLTKGGYRIVPEPDVGLLPSRSCEVQLSDHVMPEGWWEPAGPRMQMYGPCPDGSFFNPSLSACAIPTTIDLDPSDWTELENSLPSADPQTVSNAAGDSMRRQGAPLPGYTDLQMTGPSSVSGPSTTSTSTDPVTGDTTVTETSSQTYINYGDTTITTNTTTTSTTYQNGQETGTTVETETPGELPVESGGGGASGDWPGFCDWATVVCDWLDWTREDPPPEQDLPQVIDDDFYQEKQISFGSKTCPEPYAISLAPFMDTTVGVSFQPLCDFAGLIYYMVMAASYIIAAYILIGVARNA